MPHQYGSMLNYTPGRRAGARVLICFQKTKNGVLLILPCESMNAKELEVCPKI